MSKGFERLSGHIRSARFAVSAFLLCMTVLGSPAAHALTPTEQDEVQNFTLTEDFVQRFGAANQEVQAKGVGTHPGQIQKQTSGKTPTLDTFTVAIEQNPGEMDILKRHGLTARQAVLGTFVLGSARLRDMQLTRSPDLAKKLGPPKDVSAANMAFYEAHKDEIHQLLAVKPH
ncbi:hypothetical protein [Paraburkholderia acidicola]|nr:hypothetical protein [Paraburkholderia acidicola]